MKTPMFQHRHYVKLASIIATIPNDEERARVADLFCEGLRGTNPYFSAVRFAAAAMGEPCNGRDKAP